ncbi:DUF3581 domain-containing protein [Aestuariicella hydrocarbonica]|uniref:DUF3581 domain-containing protein n=1 Tax=Pseudomaricurvus hydrocarbonicus TaxID=1470433 RepID=A0A9E5JS61_9GAMM|nr:DUF3581 family protein [Aestuariicella hydrocarbonica]NHO65564.1 DUF3581 domain-containing protein [Aestuariicella hydrocarbonica]
MHLEQYFTPSQAEFSFTRNQACSFAKQIANDFNPIHDEDATRFCVPGDLLFAVALSKLGLSEKMDIRFSDMVSDGVNLHFEHASDGHVDIQDEAGKNYLYIKSEGKKNLDADMISKLTEVYVAFSGKTFPHLLVPLWEANEVMVNPARPLVIYESMHLELDTLDFHNPTLEYAHSSLEVNGKRGNACIRFNFKEGNDTLGHGEKRIVLSGLKPYDQKAIDGLIEFYNERKSIFA